METSTQTRPQATPADGTEADAFEELFRELYHPVRRFFDRRGCSREESQDLVQDTFVRAFRALDRFRGDAKASTWVFTIATNVWLNRLRDGAADKRSGEEVVLDEGRPVELGSGGAEERTIDGQRRALLRSAIDELPTGMRRCVLLRVYQDKSHREIADILGITVGTAKSQVSLARTRLRSRLAEHYPELGDGPRR